MADGFDEIKTSSQISFEFVPKLDDLKSSISSWDKKTTFGNGIKSKPGYELLSNEVAQVIEKIEKALPIVKLGDIANILIGVVTGANKFFIINKNDAELWNISKKFQKPIFPRFKLNNGIRFTLNDWEKRLNENQRCIFIDTRGSEVEKDKLLDVYLDSFPIEEKESNVTFGKRPIWHQPQYMDIPDAFFPYMNNLGPRIILNEAKTLCTNTIHRIFLKKIDNKRFKNKDRKLLAITILSTFSQLLAELEGRVYGSGAIKHEPNEAKRIKIIFPQEIEESLVNKEFNQINKLFRKNFIKPDSNANEIVRKKVDKFLINHFKIDGLGEKFAAMEIELIKIRNRRK